MRPWGEGPRFGFQVLVDSGMQLPAQYGLRAIPSAIVIDPDGVVRLKVAQGFQIGRPESVVQLEAALDGRVPPARAVGSGAKGSLSEQARRLFAEGAGLYARGARAQAAATWRRAAALQPDSLIMRKQLWRALHPERFSPQLDLEWQRAQLVRESEEGIEAANPLPAPGA